MLDGDLFNNCRETTREPGSVLGMAEDSKALGLYQLQSFSCHLGLQVLRMMSLDAMSWKEKLRLSSYQPAQPINEDFLVHS